MKENVKKPEPKEVVKGNSEDFIKKAEAADKKPVQKNIDKKPNNAKKKNDVKKSSEQNGKPAQPIVKKPLTRAQIAEKKFGVESTWRPFEAFFNKNKDEK